MQARRNWGYRRGIILHPRYLAYILTLSESRGQVKPFYYYLHPQYFRPSTGTDIHCIVREKGVLLDTLLSLIFPILDIEIGYCSWKLEISH